MSDEGPSAAGRPDRLGGEDEDPALAGVAVAVASSLVTMGVALLVADGPLARFVDGSGATLTIPQGTQVGWAYLAAHGVPINVTAERWRLGGELVGSPVLYAVPPVTLLVGGYLVARMDGRATPVEGFRAGALTAVGYVLVVGLAAVGTRYAVSSAFADLRVRADLLRAIWAGLAYPLGFGGAGGMLAAVVRDRVGPGRHRGELAGLVAVGAALVAAVAWAAS